MENIKNVKNASKIQITKQILMKPSEERTAGDHEVLAPIIKNLTFMKTRIINIKELTAQF